MRTYVQQIVSAAVVAAVLLLLAGCGGGGDGDAPANRLHERTPGEDLVGCRGQQRHPGRQRVVGPGRQHRRLPVDADVRNPCLPLKCRSASASFLAPQVDMTVTLAFRLTVTDDDGATASKDVSVTIQPADPGDAFVLDMSRLGDPGFRLQ